MKPRTRNRALLGAYNKGAEAFKDGKQVNACPYKVAPNGCHRRNGGTWGAVFYTYWRRGWYDAHEKALR